MENGRKFRRNIKIFGTLQLAGTVLYTEVYVALLKIFGVTDFSILEVTIWMFLINCVGINVIKYRIGRPILDHLCPHGEKSLLIRQSKNQGIEFLVSIANYLIQNSVVHVRKRTWVGVVLLVILGFTPTITWSGVLLATMNRYPTGMVWLTVGEAIRVFGFTTILTLF